VADAAVFRRHHRRPEPADIAQLAGVSQAQASQVLPGPVELGGLVTALPSAGRRRPERNATPGGRTFTFYVVAPDPGGLGLVRRLLGLGPRP